MAASADPQPGGFCINTNLSGFTISVFRKKAPPLCLHLSKFANFVHCVFTQLCYHGYSIRLAHVPVLGCPVRVHQCFDSTVFTHFVPTFSSRTFKLTAMGSVSVFMLATDGTVTTLKAHRGTSVCFQECQDFRSSSYFPI